MKTKSSRIDRSTVVSEKIQGLAAKTAEATREAQRDRGKVGRDHYAQLRASLEAAQAELLRLAPAAKVAARNC